MKIHPLLMIALISALSAVVVVVVLKLFGYSNPTAIGVGVAGGVSGAVSHVFLRKKKG